MTQEQIIEQVNAAARAEGFDPGVFASEASPVDSVATANTLDVSSLLNQFKPKPTFLVVLPTGQTIECRPFARVKERQDWQKAAKAWYQGLPKPGTPGAESHPLRDLLPADAEEAMYAHILHSLAVNPVVPIEAALALNQAPDLMLAIQKQIDEGNESCYLHAMNTLLEMEGKGLSETPGTD